MDQRAPTCPVPVQATKVSPHLFWDVDGRPRFKQHLGALDVAVKCRLVQGSPAALQIQDHATAIKGANHVTDSSSDDAIASNVNGGISQVNIPVLATLSGIGMQASKLK